MIYFKVTTPLDKEIRVSNKKILGIYSNDKASSYER